MDVTAYGVYIRLFICKGVAAICYRRTTSGDNTVLASYRQKKENRLKIKDRQLLCGRPFIFIGNHKNPKKKDLGSLFIHNDFDCGYLSFQANKKKEARDRFPCILLGFIFLLQKEKNIPLGEL